MHTCFTSFSNVVDGFTHDAVFWGINMWSSGLHDVHVHNYQCSYVLTLIGNQMRRSDTYLESRETESLLSVTDITEVYHPGLPSSLAHESLQ